MESKEFKIDECIDTKKDKKFKKDPYASDLALKLYVSEL